MPSALAFNPKTSPFSVMFYFLLLGIISYSWISKGIYNEKNNFSVKLDVENV